MIRTAGARRAATLVAAGLTAALLAACASAPKSPHGTGVPPSPQVATDDPETSVARPGMGYFKIGRPYRIKGALYTPREDEDYDEVGLASWYGQQFHGKLTANGEIFDMTRLSAAHRTLPMPIYVEVTNLENGRKVIVRMNDRGPFAGDNRIIDLSKAAARELGFINQGLTKVRVRYHRAAQVGGIAALPGEFRPADAPASRLAEATPPEPAPRVASTTEVAGAGVYVQAGAFASRASAEAVSAKVAAAGPVQLSAATIGATIFHRVRLGPFPTLATAEAALARVIELGENAKIVLEP